MFRSTAIAAAAAGSESAAGTWTLNVAKSKFSPGPAPKSTTRVYSQTADGTTMTATGVAAEGSPISLRSTYKYDGEDYPFSGSPNYAMISLKRVNASTVKSTLKLANLSSGRSNQSGCSSFRQRPLARCEYRKNRIAKDISS